MMTYSAISDKLILFALVATLATLASNYIQSTNGAKLSFSQMAKYIPDKNEAKMFRTEFKIFLANWNVRRVPLTKKYAERTLSKLYKDEKVLINEIRVLKTNLNIVDNNKERNGMRVLQVQTGNNNNNNGNKNSRASNKDDTNNSNNDLRKPRFKLSEVTGPRIEKWQQELAEKEDEFQEIRKKIEETKRLIKEPDSYISVPNNYGRVDPERQREREREVLIRDREAMEWRSQIASEQIQPTWLVDSW